jgi:hypothetical protein
MLVLDVAGMQALGLGSSDSSGKWQQLSALPLVPCLAGARQDLLR